MRQPVKDHESSGSSWSTRKDVTERVRRVEAVRPEDRLSLVARPAPSASAAEPGAAPEPWVVVLAGGEGRRLQEYTTTPEGKTVPKQFCHFRDERTLLGATLDRALRIARRERVVVVVLAAHREWWEPEVVRLPRENVLHQPFGRGTAVAIHFALAHIQRRDPSARIVVMPSDHDFEDETTLLGCVANALHIAERFPLELVLLGIVPSHLDAEYGLIQPGTGRMHDSRPVRAFVEKPTLTLAAQLARAGALWNSFIFACTGGALRDVLDATLPWLGRTYRAHMIERGGDPLAVNRMFEGLPVCDFSHDVLERNAGRLRLVEVPPCGWTDLGTPARLAGWLVRHREAPFWREHRMPFLHGNDDFPGALQAGGA